MKAVVLGAAAGGGYPQWNCRCPVCALAWSGDRRVRPATQSSLAVSADGTEWVVLNASPDIRAQIAAVPALHPAHAGRHSPIAAVVLSNGDIDHIAGLLSLRERQAFGVYALDPVHDMLDSNPVFNVIQSASRVRVEPEKRLEIAGLSVELFAVPGKVPLYLEGANPVLGSKDGETAGVMIRHDGMSLAYVPGCADLDPALSERLAHADAVLFDGTLFTDDEMIRAGLGEKTGRRMGHVPISGEDGSLHWLSSLPARRKAYIHINNTNPILIDGSPERREVEQAGIEIARDGLEIEL